MEANALLVKQLEDTSNELRELKALIKKEIFEKRGQRISILHQTITAGLVATKSPILTQV
jgi:hypothetical protein